MSSQESLSQASIENVRPFMVCYLVAVLLLSIMVAYYRPFLAVLSLSMFLKYKSWQSELAPDVRMLIFYGLTACISVVGIAQENIYLAILVAVVVSGFEFWHYRLLQVE